MSLFRDSVDATLRNAKAVAIYVGFSIVASTLNHSYTFLSNTADRIKEGQHFSQADIAVDLIVYLVACIGQTMVFAMLVADIDRPLWKYDGPIAALKKYFTMWYFFGLINILFNVLIVTAYRHDAAKSSLNMLLFLQMVLIILLQIFGTCLMFMRRPPVSEYQAVAAPLMHFFPQTIVIGFLYFLFLDIFQSLVSVVRPELPSAQSISAILLITVASAILECVAACAIFILCRNYRETAHDDDFDF